MTRLKAATEPLGRKTDANMTSWGGPGVGFPELLPKTAEQEAPPFSQQDSASVGGAAKILTAPPLSEEQHAAALAAFRKADADRNGVLSFDEFERAFGDAIVGGGRLDVAGGQSHHDNAEHDEYAGRGKTVENGTGGPHRVHEGGIREGTMLENEQVKDMQQMHMQSQHFLFSEGPADASAALASRGAGDRGYTIDGIALAGERQQNGLAPAMYDDAPELTTAGWEAGQGHGFGRSTFSQPLPSALRIQSLANGDNGKAKADERERLDDSTQAQRRASALDGKSGGALRGSRPGSRPSTPRRQESSRGNASRGRPDRGESAGGDCLDVVRLKIAEWRLKFTKEVSRDL